MKEGRFDIADSSESSKSRKVNLVKNVLIVVLAVVVIVLAVKLAVGSGDEGGGGGDGGDGEGGTRRPLPPPHSNAKDRNGRDVCMSEHCVNAASRLFKSMNLKVRDGEGGGGRWMVANWF